MSRWRVLGFGGVAVLVAALCFALLAISMSQHGDAAFPGNNGKIAYSSGDEYSYSSAGIWSANADGGSPALLTSGAGVSDPSYSPDGSQIAFDRESGVAVMSGTGFGLEQLLVGVNSQSTHTEWEKDYVDPHSGKTIPIVRIQSFAYEWQTFNHPAFSPSGSQLVVAEASGKHTSRSICAVEALNEQTCLGWGDPNAYFNYESSCIACGSHLIAISSQTGARIEALTSLVGERRDTKPTYSANGKIAFSREGNKGESSIFVIGSPGAAPQRVTTGQSDHDPDFSPDGSKIVFSHGYADIGVVGVGGGAVQLLPVPALPAGGGYVNSPAFSPDGSRIVFRRAVYGPQGKDETGLFTMALDGSGLTRIAADGYAPSWQPLPPPPPPAARAKWRAKKGKIALDRKGRAKIGTITCGGTTCALKVLSVKLKAGKTSCRQVRTRLAKSLAPGKRVRLGIKVYGKCLVVLEEAGKGRLAIRVRVTDGLGKKVMTLKSTLLPPKSKKGKRGRQ